MWTVLICCSKYQINVTPNLLWEQQTLRRLGRSYQHIYIMHIDTRYKWKPIKGENHILLLLWCKGKHQLPLTTVFLQVPIYRRLLPQFCKLQLTRKLQLPSIFCRHQPTGGSNLSQLQLTSIKIQLDREAPTSSIQQHECLLIYLRYQLWSVASLTFLDLLCFILLYSAFSISALSLSLSSLSFEFIKLILYRNSHKTVCIPQGIWNG